MNEGLVVHSPEKTSRGANQSAFIRAYFRENPAVLETEGFAEEIMKAWKKAHPRERPIDRRLVYNVKHADAKRAARQASGEAPARRGRPPKDAPAGTKTVAAKGRGKKGLNYAQLETLAQQWSDNAAANGDVMLQHLFLSIRRHAGSKLL